MLWVDWSVVRRPSVESIISETVACVVFSVGLFGSPGQSPRTFFEFLKKNVFLIFYEYFSFSLTWDPMGGEISKRYSSYRS